jgi:hypothetical protein
MVVGLGVGGGGVVGGGVGIGVGVVQDINSQIARLMNVSKVLVLVTMVGFTLISSQLKIQRIIYNTIFRIRSSNANSIEIVAHPSRDPVRPR